jgi:hypothetical protein
MGEIEKARSLFKKAQELFPGLVARNLAGLGSHADPKTRERSGLFMRIAAGLADPSAAEAYR